MKVSIQTLGCKVNQSESASIEGILRDNGHEIVKYTENPDVSIINTCSVTAKSDYHSRQIIRKAAKTGARVIATGCYAQLRPDDLSGIDGLDLILGNSGKSEVLEYLNTHGEDWDGCRVKVGKPDFELKSFPYYSSRSRAFLKIQDGCNLSCSYCTVPKARGKSRSLNPDRIFESVEKLISHEYKEIVLTGIHIGTYGLDLKPETSLFKIVDKIVKRYPDLRFRLSSIEPQEFDHRFLDLINKGQLCSHIHIPLQSGSDRILTKMNRGYNKAFFRRVIEEIYGKCPDSSIGTDLIVGFPGESESDFLETLNFIEEMPFSYIHIFPYSKRPGTPAAAFKGQISRDDKKNRAERANDIAKKKKNLFKLRYLERNLNVIIEKRDITTGYYRAISDNYIRLFVQDNALKSGQRLDVQCTILRNHELICKPLLK